jgi:hypothetical protein
MAFQPCGVLTLTTDFGHKGPYVASMKGVMLTRFPAARIVDLTHETSVHWPAEAGFWLRRAYPYFPRGTVHVGVVDPGVGTGRRIVAALLDDHLFLAPDNGLLAPLLADRPTAQVVALDPKIFASLGATAPSATFHGRDIFAPVAAELAAGRLPLPSIGPRVELDELVPSWVDEPQRVGAEVHGTVITFDHFGNIITNIDGALLGGMQRPVARLAGQDFVLRRTYAESAPGEYLALVNSFGVVEIACAEASAHEGLGAERGAPVIVRDAPSP